MLNSIFDDRRPQCVKGKILDLTFGDRELNRTFKDDNKGLLDIRATTDQGQIVDIEVYTYRDQSLIDRSLFYFAKLYNSMPVPDNRYDKKNPVIIINILKENMFPAGQEYHSSYSLRNDTTHELGTDKLAIHIIETRKCADVRVKNKLIRWMNYLSGSSIKEFVDLAQHEPLYKSVLDAEKMFFRDSTEMALYEYEEKRMMTEATLYGSGFDKGKAEGIAEGRQEATAAVIKNMLSQGLAVEIINKFTGVPEAEINRILNDSHN